MQVHLEDSALALAQKIVSLIRESGITLIEAQAALSVASALLPTMTDIAFKREVAACSEMSEAVAP